MSSCSVIPQGRNLRIGCEKQGTEDGVWLIEMGALGKWIFFSISTTVSYYPTIRNDKVFQNGLGILDTVMDRYGRTR